ncbi:Zn-dependent hydrolase [Luteimicrobium album]|uniref:Zn-dependent hydrolase n=1 Tax=Luteimicrobium album TaxID=1054550 RepID=A0ABQ6I400_9MICO|nr:allantoate amidohydrolase [Luteimicrobium album]GMA24529.1 Zn-dependent hydrolase [Luteimicrobium album]
MTTTATTTATGRAATAAARVMARADELGAISARPDALERTHLTPEHRRAADLVGAWMGEAGLAVHEDAAGNLCGRLEGARPGLPAVLLGSHVDTVPDAGRYDGMLGVLLAIEVARGVRPGELPFALEVVAFSDEEGTRFGSALSGSRALAGSWVEDWWGFTDSDGVTMADAFAAYGLDPSRVGEAAREPGSLVAYLEAHIEQGPFLEEADLPLAVVSSIAGARRFALTMTGRAGHAGGTPYERRRDALVGAAELVVEVERIGRSSGVVATVGRLQAFPGGVNVVPGVVELSLDLRAADDAARDAAWVRIEAAAERIAAARSLRFGATETYRADAVACAPWLRDAVRAGIDAAGAPEPLALWSRAGHDAMVVAGVAPVGMLFVRNGNGGVSHSPDEIVAEADVAVALDAFAATVAELAHRFESDDAARVASDEDRTPEDRT